MTTDTVTATAVFEINGWTCTSAGGVEVSPEVAANETVLRIELIKYFADEFIVTGEPEVTDIRLDGLDPDTWLAIQDTNDDEEGDE